MKESPVESPLHEEMKGYAAGAPDHARVGPFLAGTAGWTEPELLKSGVFYPKDANTAEKRLRHYASRFSFVEVDATFYALLSERVVEGWCAAAPPGFSFHIKAHPILTGHALDAARLPADLRDALHARGISGERLFPADLPPEIAEEIRARFFGSLAKLREEGRLAGVLLQFPPWFEATRGSVRVIEQFRKDYPDEAFSVEFRHKSWFESARFPRVLDALRAENLSYVAVDGPIEVTGIPFLPALTTELGVVRMHGRNVDGWAKKGSRVTERFNYLYSKSELSAVAKKLLPLAEEVKEVHVVFNNCVRDFAVVGASALSRVLHEEISGASGNL